jgi:hypothetical protein
MAETGSCREDVAEVRYSVVGPSGTAALPVWIDDV